MDNQDLQNNENNDMQNSDVQNNAENAQAAAAPQGPDLSGAKVKTINKHIFAWVFCFLLGGFGVDRFMRGQIGVGIAKLCLGWLTLGIWPLIDWIIALVKAYGSAYGNEENITFINGKYSK